MQRKGISPEEQLEIKKKAFGPMMWVGISSIVMLFAGFSSAFIVARNSMTWVKIFPPTEFYISSVIIVLSSITFWLAVKFAKKEQFGLSSVLVGLTLLLGIGFVKFQVDGWKYLNERGQFFTSNKISYLVENKYSTVEAVYGEDYIVMLEGKPLVLHNGQFYDERDTEFSSPKTAVDLTKDNNAASYMYILTGLHIVHLIGGLLSLIVVFIKSLRKKYTKDDHVGIQVSSIYWHFLDFLWLYLLGLLYFVG